MYQRIFVTGFFFVLLHSMANASGEPSIPFVDGRWHGDVETDANSSEFKECWASTSFNDGTTLALAKQTDGHWHLRVSNPSWQLTPSQKYDMIALVDYYPQQVRTTAEAKSGTRLKIANLDQISLLGLIENGHTIDLKSAGFNGNYDLEGSAKVIERIRACFADRG